MFGRISMLVEALGDGREIIHLFSEIRDFISRQNRGQVDIAITVERFRLFLECIVCDERERFSQWVTLRVRLLRITCRAGFAPAERGWSPDRSLVLSQMLVQPCALLLG